MKFAYLALLPMALSVPADAQTVDQVLIDKSERTLMLLSGTTTIRTYRNIKLGDAPNGHKQFEGDEKTPEGIYRIDGRNPGSRYYRSLRISYPNPVDRAFAKRAGRSPGGEIFIHGQPNGSPVARLPYDWTDGCIALSNAEMTELWRLVRTGTRVVIRP
jgi:murein L,D-transpeptidase YafK